LITFIAAVHYFYMRDYWASLVNRLLFPLCWLGIDGAINVSEFYLILKVAGAKQSLLWKMNLLLSC
jgi:hypothetical protein